MDSVRFQARIDDEGVIRAPEGVTLPQGEVEVVVRPLGHGTDDDPLVPTRAWLLQLAADAEALAPALPADLAANHDYYAHGKPHP